MTGDRKFFVGGNWKLNGNTQSIDVIIKFLNDSCKNANVGKWQCRVCFSQFLFIFSFQPILSFSLNAKHFHFTNSISITFDVSRSFFATYIQFYLTINANVWCWKKKAGQGRLSAHMCRSSHKPYICLEFTEHHLQAKVEKGWHCNIGTNKLLVIFKKHKIIKSINI